MTSTSLVAFGAVFVGASLGLSLLLSIGLLLARRRLRRLGPWVERQAAAAALVLPPLLALGLVGALAAHSALALRAGTDHCLAHAHHHHLCLRHAAAWASEPWALCLVVGGAVFVAVRLALALRAQASAQRSVSRLRALGAPIAAGAYLVPSQERFAFTAGLLSPTVVLSSAAWQALDPEQREAVLAHELAHVAHRDLGQRAALEVASWFGVPFLASRALRLWELSAERLCDRRAALAVERPSTVASAVLALARTTAPRLAPEAASFAAASQVPERIESLLREEPGGERSSRRLLLALALASLLAAAACAAFAASLHHTIETILG